MKIFCPHCKQSYEIEPGHLGIEVECQSCKNNFIVSAPGKEQPKQSSWDEWCEEHRNPPDGMKNQTTHEYRNETGDQTSSGKLIQCPDCGKMVSRRAASCPGCGGPISAAQRPATIVQQMPSANGSPIRVNTGENMLNRNRGCADLLIIGAVIIAVIFIISIIAMA